MKEVELEVANSNYPQRHGDTFTLVLKEKGGNRFVPIVIGIEEAKVIIMEVNHIKMRRPFAHDLLLQLCEETQCSISEVRINDFRDGIYFVSITVQTPNGLVFLDSRVSDAVVLALKSDAPILMTGDVFERTCYSPSPIDPTSRTSTPPGFVSLRNLPLDTLQKMLDEAVQTENYERAAEIDEEIKRRKSNE